jgi:HTH-type transcriptional regulator/antitoxin HigA
MNDSSNNKYSEIDAILKGVFEENLRDKFEKRLHELGTNQTNVLKMLQMERKTLLGILDGTQKRANLENLHKLAVFLNIPTEELIQIHISHIEKNATANESDSGKKKFIRENFDLTVLKKSGFIKDVTDFEAVEKRITSFFGLKTILDYKKRAFDAAYMAGAIVPKNTTTREFWLTSAKLLATKLDNPYYYDRQNLIKYFPQIRWNTINVEYGLVNVIKALFKLGVTVVFQPSLSSLHLRGATFSVNDQPCIALTDYKGFYPTLWHCLIHELYHVLFDWDEIKSNSYHLSEDPIASLTLNEKETDADNFAREYLFSASKLEDVKPYLRDKEFIDEVA